MLPLVSLISFGIAVTNGQEIGCPLCPDFSEVGSPDKLIPTTGETCEDIELVPIPEESDDCEEHQRGAAWCGCPDISQECHLCPGMEPSPTPDLEAPLTGLTCLDYEYLSSKLTDEECPSLPELSGNFDISAYCSCPGTEPPGLCEMCPGGSFVDPDEPIGIIEGMTCKDVDEQLLQYFTNELICLDFRRLLLQTACECTGAPSSAPSASPTDEPTLRPSSTPTKALPTLLPKTPPPKSTTPPKESPSPAPSNPPTRTMLTEPPSPVTGASAKKPENIKGGKKQKKSKASAKKPKNIKEGKKQKKSKTPKDAKKNPKLSDDSTVELEEPNMDSGDVATKRPKKKGGIPKGPKLSDKNSRLRG
jgi:hypothetical protein